MHSFVCFVLSAWLLTNLDSECLQRGIPWPPWLRSAILVLLRCAGRRWEETLRARQLPNRHFRARHRSSCSAEERCRPAASPRPGPRRRRPRRSSPSDRCTIVSVRQRRAAPSPRRETGPRRASPRMSARGSSRPWSDHPQPSSPAGAAILHARAGKPTRRRWRLIHRSRRPPRRQRPRGGTCWRRGGARRGRHGAPRSRPPRRPALARG